MSNAWLAKEAKLPALIPLTIEVLQVIWIEEVKGGEATM
jgi:hypothetical protein